MHFYNTLADYEKGERAKLDALPSANLPERGIITRVLASPSGQAHETHPATYSVTSEVPYLDIDHLGILDDRHRRATRRRTGREEEWAPKGVWIREHRHLFAVSPADCLALSNRLGVEISPELLGANIIIEREDMQPYSLCAVPQNTYFSITPRGSQTPESTFATLKHYTEQQGCGRTGLKIG